MNNINHVRLQVLPAVGRIARKAEKAWRRQEWTLPYVDWMVDVVEVDYLRGELLVETSIPWKGSEPPRLFHHTFEVSPHLETTVPPVSGEEHVLLAEQDGRSDTLTIMNVEAGEDGKEGVFEGVIVSSYSRSPVEVIGTWRSTFASEREKTRRVIMENQPRILQPEEVNELIKLLIGDC